MRFVFATTNKHKALEAQAIMSRIIDDVELLTLDDIGFIDDIIENGTTFAENAYVKAHVTHKFCLKQNISYPVIADDSGLTVKALQGAPGIYSARYAAMEKGEYGNSSDEENIELLLKNLEGITSREASFVCALCYIDTDGSVVEVSGSCDGEILEKKMGDDGFGYDPVFFYPPKGKTLAELSREEKNEVSHRNAAFIELCEKLK